MVMRSVLNGRSWSNFYSSYDIGSEGKGFKTLAGHSFHLRFSLFNKIMQDCTFCQLAGGVIKCEASQTVQSLANWGIDPFS